MDNNEIEDLELKLLLEAVFIRYGYDFRNYSRASVKRRVKHFMAASGYAKVSEIIPALLYRQSVFENLLQYFSVTVTEMFRDPEVYGSLRIRVIPLLRTYPFLKIWHAGCASGEEVYSLAILLHEEGIYDRCTIYATDFNEIVLEKARRGIYPIADIKKHLENYRLAGGTFSLTDYFDAHYESVIMSQDLKKNITFARHNLVTDQVFGEIHLILCRNVLIYFNQTLQERVFKLFDESLVRGGFLCLGKKESLKFFESGKCYEEVEKNMQIYRKKLA
ncbi:MAG: protein-glutamate O-methyltransferase CheR [Desulfobulbaceae bacterium]|nr:protein-glutamate O-methyltransferase CheR [Desulfobulbaceae bacterium]